MATYASVATAILLIVAKFFAWFWTGSVSILASLVDSLMDALASLINLFAVHYSLRPADNEHRYGHGKAQPIAGLAQAAFICASAMFLMAQSIERFMSPKALESKEIGLAVMVFATLLTAALISFQRRVIKQTQSVAIKADSLHYLTDLLTNISVMLALLLSFFGWIRVDAMVAMAVAVFILYSALRIGYESFQQLMDHEVSDEEQSKILEMAKAHPDVLGVHDLRTRRSGQQTFIQMHLEIDGQLPLFEAHQISDKVEQDINSLFLAAEIIIHKDPI